MRVKLPQGGGWGTVRDHLVARLAAGDGVVDGMLDAGLIVGADGRPVERDTAYVPGMFVWFHRELPDEERVPFALDVVYRDEHIVVADKPHFLATTPRGSHVAETALARLRRDLGIPDARRRAPARPAHRRPCAVHRTARGARRVPVAVPGPARAQGVRGGRRRTTRRSPFRVPCAAGS